MGKCADQIDKMEIVSLFHSIGICPQPGCWYFHFLREVVAVANFAISTPQAEVEKLGHRKLAGKSIHCYKTC